MMYLNYIMFQIHQLFNKFKKQKLLIKHTANSFKKHIIQYNYKCQYPYQTRHMFDTRTRLIQRVIVLYRVLYLKKSTKIFIL